MQTWEKHIRSVHRIGPQQSGKQPSWNYSSMKRYLSVRSKVAIIKMIKSQSGASSFIAGKDVKEQFSSTVYCASK